MFLPLHRKLLPPRSLLHNDDSYTILNSSYAVNSRSSKSATNTCRVRRRPLTEPIYAEFSSEKTYSCQLDLKRLKHARGSRVGLSLFIYIILNHQVAQITKSLFSQENLYWPLPRKIFQNNYLEFTLKGDFFSQLVDFLVISDQHSYKK